MTIFETFESTFTKMDSVKKEELVHLIEACIKGRNPYETNLKPLQCPHCSHNTIKKHGKCRNVQKFKCKSCNKEFRYATNTVAYHSKQPEKIREYIKCLLDSLSVRKTASKVGVSIPTAFQWRHRILAAFESIQSSKLTAKVQLEIAEHDLSLKGISNRSNYNDDRSLYTQSFSISYLYDIEGNMSIFMNPKGVLTSSFIKQTIVNTFVNIREVNTHPIPKISRVLKSRVPKITYSQNDNNESKHFEVLDWLTQFNGVASKYLQHYFNWFVFLNCYESPLTILQKIKTLNYNTLNIYSLYRDLRDKHAFT